MTVDKSAARIRRMFAEIAGRYDLLNRLLSLGIDRYWRWRTTRLVPLVGEAPVLDVCTGTGDLALAYWRAAKGRTWIVGSDFCRPMLAIAARKSRRAGAQGEITLIEADTGRLPLADDCFQIVCVAFGLRNLSQTDLGLREMTRVLRPGGRLVVLEFSMPRGRFARAVYGWYFRCVLPRVGQSVAPNRQGAYNYLPVSVGEFAQHEALAERIRAAGVGEVRYYRFTFGIATLYVGTK